MKNKLINRRQLRAKRKAWERVKPYVDVAIGGLLMLWLMWMIAVNVPPRAEDVLQDYLWEECK